MPRPADDPHALRAIFGANLRLLAADSPSVAQLCRELGINRTQFNRYLSGEAYPRPDILHRICRYFDRDARILLQPLEQLDADRTQLLGPHMDLAPFRRMFMPFDTARVPPGLYQLAVRSLVDGQSIMLTLIRLSVLPNGAAAVDWPVPRRFAEMTGQPAEWSGRRSTGIVAQHPDGFSMLLASNYTRNLRLLSLSYGFRESADVHTGFAVVTQRIEAGQPGVQPVAIERVRPGWQNAMAARRRCNDRLAEDDLPPLLREYFRDWDSRR